MSDTRIYRVADGDDVRLIEAANPAQALRFCAAARYQIEVARPKDVAYLMSKGVKVERAKGED